MVGIGLGKGKLMLNTSSAKDLLDETNEIDTVKGTSNPAVKLIENPDPLSKTSRPSDSGVKTRNQVKNLSQSLQSMSHLRQNSSQQRNDESSTFENAAHYVRMTHNGDYSSRRVKDSYTNS